MSGFPILDLVVGMIFIFFLLSIISSSAVEMVMTARKIRAKMLEAWLFEIFKGTLAKEIMNHCSITGLSQKDEANSYMDAKNFTTVIIEKITYDPNNPNSVTKSLNDIISALEKTIILEPELKRSFLMYAAEAKETYSAVSDKAISEIGLFRNRIENWYDSSMDRVTGKMKEKHTRKLTFWLGAIIVIALNADSISIAKYLYNNPEARVALAEKAYDATKDTALQNKVARISENLETSSDPAMKATADEIKQTIISNAAEIKATKELLYDDVPLGWNIHVLDDGDGRPNALMIIPKIVGLLASILAIMMGAPFWFDILNKVSNLRGAGKKPEESDKK